MSIELCVLASGSSGNATLVRTPAGVMLIDAGIGPRTCAKRLNGTGVGVRDVRAICLTHLDSDHFRTTWLANILQQQIRVYCHRKRSRALLNIAQSSAQDPAVASAFAQLLRPFDESFEPLDGLRVRSIGLAHDETGSHGFVMNGFGCRVGYATDLGHVPSELYDRFCDLDVLALESNYDVDMQRNSARPWFLKNRIMGGSGHLSNDQAFDAIRELLGRCESAGRRLPSHIVLLHRSRQCNCPKLVRRVFERDPRIAPRLTLAEQFARTDWLRPRPMPPVSGEQLALAWE